MPDHIPGWQDIPTPKMLRECANILETDPYRRTAEARWLRQVAAANEPPTGWRGDLRAQVEWGRDYIRRVYGDGLDFLRRHGPDLVGERAHRLPRHARRVDES